jgi:hypothetical protein
MLNKNKKLLKGGRIRMSRHHSLQYTLVVFKKELYGIGKSKHEAKKVYGGKSPLIHSHGTYTRYFGIAKEFVDQMYQEEIRRTNQVPLERLKTYLIEKAESETEKTMKLTLSAFSKYLSISSWRDRKDLRELIVKERPTFLERAGESGQALPFTNPERVIEKMKHPHHQAIATIQLLTGARIDDVPKVAESLRQWREDQRPIICILKSKGGRNRWLDYEDRMEKFNTVWEAVQLLLPFIDEEGWMKIKEEHYSDLRRAAAACMETYTGSHAFRVNYAQRRHKGLLDKGFSEKEALKILTQELGHNRISVAKGYVYR